MRINFIDRENPEMSDFFIRTENLMHDIPPEAKSSLLENWKIEKLQEYRERNIKIRALVAQNKETLKEIKEGFNEFVQKDYPELYL